MSDTTMILYLNANQTNALYDLQAKLIEMQTDLAAGEFTGNMGKQIDEAIDLYRRVMCPTYEPEKN